MKRVNDVCKLTGLSKKALYHYEHVGLICSLRSSNSYRYYSDADINRLKQILLFKEMDFSLSQIAELLIRDTHDIKNAFSHHKDVLQAKRNRLDKIIKLVDSEIKGENMMSFKEFDMTEIDEAKKKYAVEAKEKWGNSDTYKKSINRTNTYTKEDWKKIHDESDKIFSGFSSVSDVKSDEANNLVMAWKKHITKYYYTCTDDILMGLADMYILDERFKNNIDKYGKGTSERMSDSIKTYLSK